MNVFFKQKNSQLCRVINLNSPHAFEALFPCSGSFHLPRLPYTCTVSLHQAMKRKSLTLFTQQGDGIRGAVLMIVYILSYRLTEILPPALVVLFFPLFPSSASSMEERGDYHSILLDPRGPVSFQTLLCVCVCGRKQGRSGPLKVSVTHPWMTAQRKFQTYPFFMTVCTVVLLPHLGIVLKRI